MPWARRRMRPARSGLTVGQAFQGGGSDYRRPSGVSTPRRAAGLAAPTPRPPGGSQTHGTASVAGSQPTCGSVCARPTAVDQVVVPLAPAQEHVAALPQVVDPQRRPRGRASGGCSRRCAPAWRLRRAAEREASRPVSTSSSTHREAGGQAGRVGTEVVSTSPTSVSSTPAGRSSRSRAEEHGRRRLGLGGRLGAVDQGRHLPGQAALGLPPLGRQGAGGGHLLGLGHVQQGHLEQEPPHVGVGHLHPVLEEAVRARCAPATATRCRPPSCRTSGRRSGRAGAR